MKLQHTASRRNGLPAKLANFVPLYQTGLVNICPCCGQRQWIVGRTMAECAFCDAALPISHGTDRGTARRFTVLPQAA
jgi:hypothetical protein